MKALAIDWRQGQGCVKPSLENVLAGTYNPLVAAAVHLRQQEGGRRSRR